MLVLFKSVSLTMVKLFPFLSCLVGDLLARTPKVGRRVRGADGRGGPARVLVVRRSLARVPLREQRARQVAHRLVRARPRVVAHPALA